MLTLRNRCYRQTETTGEFHLNDRFIAFSLELPWKSNQPNISCVPSGIYDLVEYDSPKHGKVLALSNPNLGVSLNGKTPRTYIEIHVANWTKEIVGCIAPGKVLKKTGDFAMVQQSRIATEEIYNLFKAGEFTQLNIHP